MLDGLSLGGKNDVRSCIEKCKKKEHYLDHLTFGLCGNRTAFTIQSNDFEIIFFFASIILRNDAYMRFIVHNSSSYKTFFIQPLFHSISSSLIAHDIAKKGKYSTT